MYTSRACLTARPYVPQNQCRRPVGARQRHARIPCFVRKHKRLTTKSHSKDVRSRACLTARPYVPQNQRRRPVGARQRHARIPCFVRKHKRLTTKSHSKDVHLAGVLHGAPLRFAKSMPQARKGAPKARPNSLFRPKTQAVNDKITLERCTPRGRASRRAPTFRKINAAGA